MNDSYILQLVFETDQNKRHTVRVPGADPFIDADDIIYAMNDIIESNVILTTNGELTGRHSATLTRTEVQDIDV